MLKDFAKLENKLGITFNDPALLEEALTHRSFLNEQLEKKRDNERLEFLGDAVIDFIVGAYLFNVFQEMQEGELTPLRAALVQARTLSKFCRELTIDKHLLLGFGEDEGGGRQRTSTLCAAFEAIIGALYLDQGLPIVTKLIHQLIIPEIEHILTHQLHKDPKSEFQIWAQAVHNLTPTYETIATEGPDHAKQFTVVAKVGEAVWGEGRGSSKQAAARDAAKTALTQIPIDQNQQVK